MLRRGVGGGGLKSAKKVSRIIRMESKIFHLKEDDIWIQRSEAKCF